MVTNFGEAEIRSKIIKAMAYYARLIVIEFLKGLEHLAQNVVTSSKQ